MRYLFYLFLIYWVYQRFFADNTPPLQKRNDTPKHNNDNDIPKQTNTPRFKGGEFVDYEEIKD